MGLDDKLAIAVIYNTAKQDMTNQHLHVMLCVNINTMPILLVVTLLLLQPQPWHHQMTPLTPTNTTIDDRQQWTTPMPLEAMTIMCGHERPSTSADSHPHRSNTTIDEHPLHLPPPCISSSTHWQMQTAAHQPSWMSTRLHHYLQWALTPMYYGHPRTHEGSSTNEQLSRWQPTTDNDNDNRLWLQPWQWMMTMTMDHDNTLDDNDNDNDDSNGQCQWPWTTTTDNNHNQYTYSPLPL